MDLGEGGEAHLQNRSGVPAVRMTDLGHVQPSPLVALSQPYFISRVLVKNCWYSHIG